MEVKVNQNVQGTLGYPLAQENTTQGTAAKLAENPLLAGNAVTMISPNDYMQLVAILQDELSQRNLSIAKLKLSAALATLTGIANGISEQQSVLLEILRMKTESLENLIRAFTVTEAERKKLLEKKAQLQKLRTEAQRELEELNKKEADDDLVGDAADGATEDVEKRKRELIAEIAGYDKQINDLDGQVKQKDQELKANKDERKKLQSEIDGLVSKLDSRCLGILFAAERITAADVVNVAENLEKEEEDDDETLNLKVKKSIIGIIEQSLDKATQDMRDEFEKQKLSKPV